MLVSLKILAKDYKNIMQPLQVTLLQKTLGKMVYFESFENKTDALKREKFIKNQKSREFIKKLIHSSSTG